MTEENNNVISINGNTPELEVHEYAKLFPPYSKLDLFKLSEDIRQNGQLETIKLYQGQILDGRNRYAACQKLRIVPRFEEYTGNDPLGYVVSANMMRRHLTNGQKAVLATRIAILKRGDNQHTSIEACSQDYASKLVGMSRSSVQRTAQAMTNGIPELKRSLELGLTSPGLAVKIAKLSAERQKEVLALDKKPEIHKELKKGDLHPADCSCGDCPKPRVHNITVSFTDSELVALQKAIRRHHVSMTREEFLHFIILEFCDERTLPPTKPEFKKMFKKNQIANCYPADPNDPDYDPEAFKIKF